MRPLFTSYACDFCDGLVEVAYQRGFIVFEGPHQLEHSPMYVFRTRTDAAVWRSQMERMHSPIVEVLTECDVRWCMSKGTIKDVELADKPFTIFADRRFTPGPYRAFLAEPLLELAA